MSRSFSFEVGEFYHCYGRGTEKRKIFLDKKDHQRFIALLYVCNSTTPIHLSDYSDREFQDLFNIEKKSPLVEIGAYCLMPNHFHILIKEITENGISGFMQKLITGYTMYFNKKNERTGALFGSKFKAQYISNNEYLKYIYSYIHLNPVKLINPEWKKYPIKNKKVVMNFLNLYQYSSYLDYLNHKRPQSVILNTKAFPDYFSNKKVFQEEIWEWLEYLDAE